MSSLKSDCNCKIQFPLSCQFIRDTELKLPSHTKVGTTDAYWWRKTKILFLLLTHAKHTTDFSKFRICFHSARCLFYHESEMWCVYAICLVQILFDWATITGLVVRITSQAGGTNRTDMQITVPVRLLFGVSMYVDVLSWNWVSCDWHLFFAEQIAVFVRRWSYDEKNKSC